MYYAQMRQYDIANGVGIRATLFVSGCTHKCPGCFNEAYQDFKVGNPWREEEEERFMTYVKNENVHGVTILGGEPMEQTMDDSLLHLLKRIKQETNHTIWIYSGYTFEQIIEDSKKLALLEQCDVLVDGPFIESLKDICLKFRGSSNQRIINVQASLDAKNVIEEKL
nr:anaerobic ribonucleoside-triphosphate reductase activating protein [uncultured Cellulosilyticum sp.]